MKRITIQKINLTDAAVLVFLIGALKNFELITFENRKCFIPYSKTHLLRLRETHNAL